MRTRGGTRLRQRAAAVVVVTACAAAAGCSGSPPDPAPPVRALVAGVSSGDLRSVPLVAGSASAATAELRSATADMGGLRPAVRLVGAPTGSGDRRTATLQVSWPLPGGAPWTYRTRARLERVKGAWRVRWAPDVVSPGLPAGYRLELQRELPARADILGAGGAVLVTARAVARIGIDKTTLPATATPDASARALAAVVGVVPGRYAAEVTAAGPKAFVPALSLRAADAQRLAARVAAVPGAIALPATLPLAPTKEFAAALLGAAGPATAEIVAASTGQVAAGDVVGRSGLQRRYDARLRGVADVTVVARPAPSGGVTPAHELVLHRVAGHPGSPVVTTLDPRLQQSADSILAGVAPASALVAIRPSSGDIVALVSGPRGAGLSTASVGHYAPGSTFKIVSALALLRAGRTPDSPVACLPGIDVEGKHFTNYSDYPAAHLGTIPLRVAFANSCNTAFIGQRKVVTQQALADAAASLGLGVDLEFGSPAFLGSVPSDAGGTEHAASLIGQGKVEASPLAMAVVAASVARGSTVRPRLVVDPMPAAAASTPASALALAPAEAAALRTLMHGVVTDGSARFLQSLPGPPVGAKAGTAEFGTGTPPKTHGWMVAIRGDLAVAVFVDEAQSGSKTAGPLLAAFLRSAG